MPSVRVTAATITDVPRFAAIGTYAGAAPLVRHVALAAEPCAIRWPLHVRVTHMGPPLEEDAGVQADVVGHGNLTHREELDIDIWVQGELSRRPASEAHWAQYVAVPAQQERRDSDGSLAYVRYSCAGFVLSAYRHVGIDLIDEAELPSRDLAALQEAFAVGARPRLLRYLGMTGPGPWPVLMPGYIFHSLARPGVRAAAYRPKSSDDSY